MLVFNSQELDEDGCLSHPLYFGYLLRLIGYYRLPISITHTLLFLRLHGAQSIWQFSGVVFPPLLHGVI